MSYKIGIGIVTGNKEKRLESFKRCLDSMPEADIVVVNYDNSFPNDVYGTKVKEVLVPSKTPAYIAICKNMLFRYFIREKYKICFIAEDDMEVMDKNIIDTYIKTSEYSGCWNLHGSGCRQNRHPETFQYMVKDIVSGFKDNPENKLFLFHHCHAFWVEYHINQLKAVPGLMDTKYKNHQDHLDLYIQFWKKGFQLPFWYVPDIPESWNYIFDMEQDPDYQSTVKTYNNFKKDEQQAHAYFTKKWGHDSLKWPQASKQEVKERLEFLYNNYSL